VRTTATDADRRQSPRFKSNLSIRVNGRGRGDLQATLVDISEGGAWIRCRPDLGTGETGSMTIAGFDGELIYTVRGRDADALHIEFDSGVHVEAYRAWFRRTFDKAAA